MARTITRWSMMATALLMAISFAMSPSGAASAESATKEKAAVVDLNTAAPADLESLPGIGPSLAKRIVEYREKNGPFASVDDLLKVQGIGEKSLARFRDLVTVGKAARR